MEFSRATLFNTIWTTQVGVKQRVKDSYTLLSTLDFFTKQ